MGKEKAIPVHIDLSDPHSIPDRFDELAKDFGPIYYLVNNAGINDRSSGLTLDPTSPRRDNRNQPFIAVIAIIGSCILFCYE